MSLYSTKLAGVVMMVDEAGTASYRDPRHGEGGHYLATTQSFNLFALRVSVGSGRRGDVGGEGCGRGGDVGGEGFAHIVSKVVCPLWYHLQVQIAACMRCVFVL